jgi:hypothetical protein
VPSRSGARYENHWTSAAGALAGVLAALGSALPTWEVAALSGHAFRFAITECPGGAFGSDGPSCFSAATALPLYERLGLRFHAIEAAPGASDYASIRKLALEEIRKSTRHRRPAIAYGLQTASFGIVLGADAEALTISSTLSGQYGSRLPLSQWPPPGSAFPLRVFVPQKEIRFTRSGSFRAAIAFAVAFARQGESGGVPGHQQLASGLAAYALWAELLEREAPIDAAGHALCIQALIEGRGEASRLLAAAGYRTVRSGCC